MSGSGTSQGFSKKGTVLLSACILVIIALVTVVIVLLMKPESAATPVEEPVADTQSKRSVLVTEDNAENVVEELKTQEFVEQGYYTVNMDTNWHFSTGDAVSDDAVVNNLPENTHDVYFDVFLASDESVAIYESPVIPRGEGISSIKLDKPLSAGTHDCIIVYHLVDAEQNTISTLRVAFTIVVDK